MSLWALRRASMLAKVSCLILIFYIVGYYFIDSMSSFLFLCLQPRLMLTSISLTSFVLLWCFLLPGSFCPSHYFLFYTCIYLFDRNENFHYCCFIRNTSSPLSLVIGRCELFYLFVWILLFIRWWMVIGFSGFLFLDYFLFSNARLFGNL